MKKLLFIQNLGVALTDDQQILDNLSLEIAQGEVHALMGPNGSGKSTLAFTLMGHPRYRVTGGSLKLSGQDLTKLSPDERARAGIFLAFQSPLEIEGVSLKELLYQAYQARFPQSSLEDFETNLVQKIRLLKIKPSLVERSVNSGLSGGEKKQAEMLQLALLQPKLAILDEIDSGLDIDSLKNVCACLNAIREENPELSLLVITHYPRILHYLVPNAVHVMSHGKIVQSGTKELAEEIEREGYSLP